MSEYDSYDGTQIGPDGFRYRVGKEEPGVEPEPEVFGSGEDGGDVNDDSSEPAAKPTGPVAEPVPEPEQQPVRDEPKAEKSGKKGDFPDHLGAGWYELSDGSRVRGKEDAQLAQAEINAGQ